MKSQMEKLDIPTIEEFLELITVVVMGRFTPVS
jgi:hypothetical protein